MDELHKEIAELKTKLTREAPVISGYDKTEAARLAIKLIVVVVGERWVVKWSVPHHPCTPYLRISPCSQAAGNSECCLRPEMLTEKEVG